MATKQAKRAGSSATKRSNRSQALANRSRDRDATVGTPVTTATTSRRSRPNDPSRSNESATTPGTVRPAPTRLTAWDKAHRAREKQNVYLVRATAYGYYANKLWKEGEEFYMGVDPEIEPPRWVVPISEPGGEILGTFEAVKEGPKGKEKITGMKVVGLDELPEDEALAEEEAIDASTAEDDDGDQI